MQNTLDAEVQRGTVRTPIGLLLVEEFQGAIVRVGLARKGIGLGLKFGKLSIACEKQLHDYFAGTKKTFSLPLAFSTGTALQRGVWKELLKIPYGERITYGELARRVGHTKAVRAVASAVGKNPICIIIPCHRVVPATGKDRIGKYACGCTRKRFLLALEERHVFTPQSHSRASTLPESA